MVSSFLLVCQDVERTEKQQADDKDADECAAEYRYVLTIYLRHVPSLVRDSDESELVDADVGVTGGDGTGDADAGSHGGGDGKVERLGVGSIR